MVFSYDNCITVSKSHQPPVTSARQPSVRVHSSDNYLIFHEVTKTSHCTIHCFITSCSELRKVLFFCSLCDFVFFVCESNISGTAERICARFTGKICMVPHSDEFECQGQRSRSPGTKNVLCTPMTPPPHGSERMVRSAA